VLEESRKLTVTSVAAAVEALGLRRREGEVLQVIATGCSNAEAAAMLGVSPFTVKKHLENIYATLGVSTRSAAVAQLLRKLGLEALMRSGSGAP
jgi:ATP/maltotriose-dependent transcriptional regulator MalT